MRVLLGNLFRITTLSLSGIKHGCRAAVLSNSTSATTNTYVYKGAPISMENNTAYQYLKSQQNYQEMFFDPQRLSSDNSESEPIKEVINRFSTYASPGRDFRNVDFDPNEVDFVISHIQNLTDEQLKLLLYQTTLPAHLPHPDATNFQRFWKRLDEEFVARSKSWTYNELFAISELWYRNNLYRETNFHWNMIKKMFRKCERLTTPEFIRFLFSLNLVRNIPSSINTYELEHCLSKHIDDINAREVSIAAMGFFKTKTPIRDFELFQKFIQLVISEASTLDSIFVASVCKLGRLSGTGKTSALLYTLQEAFLDQIGRLELTAAMHLAIIGTRTLVMHDAVLNTILRKAEGDMTKLRLKDMERLLLAFTMFDIECDNFCHQILLELRSPMRTKELTKYGRTLPIILFYLSMRNIFPYDLISQVLHVNYLEEYYGHNTQRYQREILCLDFAVGLNCPDYEGNRLSPKIRKSIARVNLLWLWPETHDKVSLYEHSVRTAATYLRNIFGGKEYVFSCNILPHFHSAELVFFLDKDQQPVKIPEAFESLPTHDVKHVPFDLLPPDTTAHAVFVCSLNSVVRNRHRRLLGQVNLQLKQLIKLGYTVHVIFPEDIHFERNETEEMKKCRTELFNKIALKN